MTTKAAESLHPHAMQWAAAQGIEVYGVAPTEISGRGLGMVATRVIEQDEVLVRVPSSMMLTIDCIPETFVELFPERTSTHGILAAFLSHGDTSLLAKWKEWRDSWPDLQSFRNCMPISWVNALELPCAEHGELGTSHYPLPPAASGYWKIMKADSTRYGSEDTYQNILPKQERRMLSAWECVLHAFPDTDWNMFSYHWFIINTRSFYYVTPGKEAPEDWNDAVGLVPIADYFNHANDEVGYLDGLVNTKAQFPDIGDIQACMATVDEKSYTISATRRIEEGEEVHISYGPHPNDYLFVEYGFFLDHNPYDVIFLDDLILKDLTASELVLKMRDLYGDYKISRDGPCPRTQDVACMTFMSPKKWQEYILHRSINATDREIMTDTINGWVGTYLNECISTIRTLENMRAASSLAEVNVQSGHDDLKLLTLLKRWIQMRDLCETMLNDTNRAIR